MNSVALLLLFSLCIPLAMAAGTLAHVIQYRKLLRLVPAARRDAYRFLAACLMAAVFGLWCAVLGAALVLP